MSQQSVVDELQQLGMSGYEAKAYVALVAAGLPLNGYEVAKRSGVPRSTVYETPGKLVGRGAAYEVRAGEASVGYLPLPPAALLDRMRREFDRSIDVLSAELPQVAAPPDTHTAQRLCELIALKGTSPASGGRATCRTTSSPGPDRGQAGAQRQHRPGPLPPDRRVSGRSPAPGGGWGLPHSGRGGCSPTGRG